MPSLGPMEILVILVVALIVIGPARLPEAGRQVGRAMTEFRRWSTGVQNELKTALDDTSPPSYGSQNKPPSTGEKASVDAADDQTTPPATTT
jgi:sec-independent protein translocase protein TatA